jgi:glycosyltransferase involved in cell wall biosynthesis
MTKYPPPVALGVLFDADFYLSQCSNDPEALKDPLHHFSTKGWQQGFDPHPLFSVRYYLYQKPDLLNSRINPLLHYLANAATQDLDPHPLFDTKYYRAHSPELAEVPLMHYIKVGFRTCSPHPLFDLDFYRQQVLVTSGAPLDHETVPLTHYLLEGVKGGLSPHPLFCGPYYCSKRPDIVEQSINPLVHYVQFGCSENAQPHPLFDAEYFARHSGIELTRFPNPLLAFLNMGVHDISPHKLFDVTYYNSQLRSQGLSELQEHPLVHYLREGHSKGYNPHPLFDSQFYRTNNPYLLSCPIEPLTHYVAWGSPEGRNPHPLFDTRWYASRYPQRLRSGITALEAYLEDWDSGGDSNPCWALDTNFYVEKRPGCRTAGVVPPFHYYSYFRLPLTVENETVSFPSTQFGNLYREFNSRVGIKGGHAPIRVILASHDASRTGAPLIALNIARELRNKYGVELFIILGRGGPLAEDFKEIGTVIDAEQLMHEQGIHNLAPHIMAILKPSRTIGLINSIESGDVLRMLVSMGVPCYSLIHEFTQQYDEYSVTSVLENSRLVVFPSDLVQRDAIVNHSRMSPKAKDTLVISQGLNDPSFLKVDREKARLDVCAELGIPRDSTIVLGVGSIQSRKGCELFIIAARQFIKRNPDCKVVFVWVGQGGLGVPFYENWLHSDIYRAGLQNKVMFLGAREDTRPYFHAADIFLHLARLDPFPCVVLEAMASKLPVVIFEEVTGAVEAVGDDAGIIVPFLDMLEAHDALTRLVDDPELRRQMGERGRARIEESYSFSQYVDTILTHVCKDRGLKQIGSFQPKVSNPAPSKRGDVPIYFGATSWNMGGTNILWKHLVSGLRRRGWDARVLFTDRLVMGNTYREPSVDHARVGLAVRDTIQERWSALQNFLMQQERCVFVTGDDGVANSITSALPTRVGVIGTLLDNSGESYEQGYRIGLYCNKIVSLSDEIAKTMSGYNPALAERIVTIPAHAVDRSRSLASRTTRRLGVPLQILFAGGSTRDSEFPQSFSSMLAALDKSGFPYKITVIADESGTSLCGRLGQAVENKIRNGTVCILSFCELEHFTKLLEEHEVLLATPKCGTLPPIVAESLANGCLPVLVDPQGGLSDLVRSGENGFVLNELDWTEVGSVLRTLYSDLSTTTRLQQAALTTRLTEYTVPDMVGRYEQVISQVVGEIQSGSLTRPKPFVWSPHFGDALPPQNVIYPHEALEARKHLDF